jgi:hypothetical protein
VKELGRGGKIRWWMLIYLSSESRGFSSTAVYYTWFVHLDCFGTRISLTGAVQSLRVYIETPRKHCGHAMLSFKGVGEEIKIESSAEGSIFINMARKEKDETRRWAWVLIYNHWT